MDYTTTPSGCEGEVAGPLQTMEPMDLNSNAAFKESSKVQLVEFIINDAGWHFRHEKPILKDCLAHIDHPYKSVRESIGRLIATIYRTRHHESFKDVSTLLEKNKAESSIGLRPYKPSDAFTATIKDVFSRLEQWRHERTPGQQTPSSYISGSKTVLIWLDSMLSSQECIQLVPFFPDPFIEQLLHMMDVKEDPELMKLAYHVYCHLPNIRFRDCASATLAGMIRCSPASIRNPVILQLQERFELQLKQNPMPKNKVPGTDTPADTQREIVRRHAAVLGLGALIEAFPYATPPPRWMPEVLEHLATRAASDPGVVGKATKAILAEFR